MTSHRPPYIEASSTVPTGSDTRKPHARNLSVDQSALAATKKTALSDLSDTLMEHIVDMRNVEKAWRKVKANKGAPGPDGITLDYLRGWTGYFCLVPIKSFFVVLDKWVRRRIRSCYWKQWRKPSARIRNLMKLGLEKNEAVPFGSCSRGAWFMSRCESVNTALTNSHLQSTGLVNLSSVRSLEQACS